MYKNIILFIAALLSTGWMAAQETQGAPVSKGDSAVVSASGKTTTTVSSDTDMDTRMSMGMKSNEKEHFMAVSNPNDTTEKEDTLGIHPWDIPQNDTIYIVPESSHWSIWAEAGFNIFDGDYTSEQRNIVWLPTVGLGVMHNFNCTWGIGAEYKFRNYKVHGKDDGRHPEILLHGYSHQVDGFITFDIFNAWRPQNKTKLFALDLILGGGAQWNKSLVGYHASDKNGESKGDFIHNMYNYENVHKRSMDKYRACGIFLGGFSAEFNITRELELGLRCVYNYTTRDEQVDFRTCGNNNDGFFDCDLILRWKIYSQPDSHVRNYRSQQSLDAWLDMRKPHCDPCEHSVDTVIMEVTHDTVIIIERMTTAEEEEQLKAHMEESSQLLVDENYCYNVYFDNDRSVLDAEAMKIVDEVGARAKEETQWYINLQGFCDNTGSDARNNELGEERCGVVEDVLVKKYGIDKARIIHIGRGRVKDGREWGSFRPNRRTEICLVDAERYNELRDEYEDMLFKRHNRIPREGKYIRGLSEYSTLANMAREYYGNSNCWVYIFDANKWLNMPTDNLHNKRIFLPYLDKDKRNISEQDANVFYEAVKAERTRTGVAPAPQDSLTTMDEIRNMVERLEDVVPIIVDSLSNEE